LSTDASGKLPITAIVVGRNEGILLGDCLQSVSFCSEIVYADMASVDNSKDIAQNMGIRVIDVELSPIVETVRQQLLSLAEHPWILYLDPDERVNRELALYLLENWHRYSEMTDLAAVRLPFFYYVYSRRLAGTVWGGEKPFIRIVHRDRFRFFNAVHFGGELVSGEFRVATIDGCQNREVSHFWLTDIQDFLRKHSRYVQAEGPARYAKGTRASLKSISIIFPKEFVRCFIINKGYRDGFLGFFLSVFWATYQFASEITLLSAQRAQWRK
jgi:glycosyltransferase involved in cell wall biosynthesis